MIPLHPRSGRRWLGLLALFSLILYECLSVPDGKVVQPDFKENPVKMQNKLACSGC